MPINDPFSFFPFSLPLQTQCLWTRTFTLQIQTRPDHPRPSGCFTTVMTTSDPVAGKPPMSNVGERHPQQHDGSQAESLLQQGDDRNLVSLFSLHTEISHLIIHNRIERTAGLPLKAFMPFTLNDSSQRKKTGCPARMLFSHRTACRPVQEINGS